MKAMFSCVPWEYTCTNSDCDAKSTLIHLPNLHHYLSLLEHWNAKIWWSRKAGFAKPYVVLSHPSGVVELHITNASRWSKEWCNPLSNMGIVGVPTKTLPSLQGLIDVEPYLYIDFVKAWAIKLNYICNQCVQEPASLPASLPRGW